MRVLSSPVTVGSAAIIAVAVLVPLAWLASGLLLGFGADPTLALHGLMLLGNLAFLVHLRRKQRREMAALHRQLAQLRQLIAAAAEDPADEPPARPAVATVARSRRSLIHDN